MNIFYSTNPIHEALRTAPGDALLVSRDTPAPENAPRLEILAVQYDFTTGGKLKLLGILPGEDGAPNPIFRAFAPEEMLYLENARGRYAIGLPAFRRLARSRRRRVLVRGLDEQERTCHKRGLHYYYTLDLHISGEDYRILLPEWSVAELCRITGWVVTDNGKSEYREKKAPVPIRRTNLCGGCV